MNDVQFVYTTYIKTTPARLWEALTNPEFTRQYWVEGIESDWKPGSSWRHNSGNDAEPRLGGTILESDPPHRLVMSWGDPKRRDAAVAHSRVTFELEAVGDMVRLNVLHDALEAGAAMTKSVTAGWPRVLSSLKSLLETGKPLDTWVGNALSCSAAVAQSV